jgi:putative ABC transport system permease protein
MYKNYFKIAVRNLTRHKLYSLLNIVGLGFGITCFLLIALFAIDEMTFDRFHDRADDIFRVVQQQQTPNEGEQYFGAVSYNISEAAINEVPGVDNGIKMLTWGRAVISNPKNQRGFYHSFLTVENSIFDIFNFPLKQGDPRVALTDPNSVVLSEELAMKLFGNEDPLGQTVKSDRGMDLKVTGVLEDIPHNSHLQFDVMISHPTIEAQPWFDDDLKGEWGSQNWFTYLTLNKGTDPIKVGQQLTSFAETRAQDDRPFEGRLELQALKDVHFQSQDFQIEFNERKGSYTYLSFFSLIGFFILGIACINYINLATARSSIYSREVGIRKVVGANMSQLFGRFMSESIVFTTLAFLLALGLTQLILPWFNVFTDKSLSLIPSEASWAIPILLGTVVLVSLASGSYPSLYLSRLQPQEVLKGSSQNNKSGRGSLRKGLVVLQFSLSIIMMIGTLVAWQQMNYVKTQDLGFDESQLIVVDINSGKVRNGYETILNGYRNLPDVTSVSVSSRVPGEWKNLLKTELRPPGAYEERGQTPWFLGADENFLETFDIELISGRNFDSGRPADSSSIILNLQAAKALGFSEASGQEVRLMSRINNGAERLYDEPIRARVIGITADFNFQSLYEPVSPLVLGYRNNSIQSIDYFTARISGHNVDNTIAQMTDILHSVDPDQLFEYHFLDEQIANFYESDTRRGLMFTIAALCAIFIACLGLFGLAAFTAEQRTKEIGIRKVLGASTAGIVRLLSLDFLKLVCISLAIASPVAWYFLNDWLQNFAYHIEIKWWVFVLVGLIAIVITFITVSFQSIKSALANPIESLRAE